MVTLAEFLRTEMATKHLTQSELARRIDVSPDYVRRWINGDIPRPEKCALIADGLGVQRNTIMGMAGYPVDDSTDEQDTQWELMQRELREIYASWDRSKWNDLLAAHKAVASLVRPAQHGSTEDAQQSSRFRTNYAVPVVRP